MRVRGKVIEEVSLGIGTWVHWELGKGVIRDWLHWERLRRENWLLEISCIGNCKGILLILMKPMKRMTPM